MCPVTNGNFRLQLLDMTADDLWPAVGVLVALFVMFKVLGLIALYAQTKAALGRK